MSTVQSDRTDPRTVDFQTIEAPLSRVAFYSAIALPAVYLPLLVTGIETAEGLALFLALLGLHIATLIGGRSYRSAE